MSYLQHLELRDFRNFSRFEWVAKGNESAQLVLITGINGSGKTNLLEAISLLVRGRGLRYAHQQNFFRRAGNVVAQEWSIKAELSGLRAPGEIETVGRSTGNGKRTLLYDGQSLQRRDNSQHTLHITWLTPQLEMMFYLEPSARRRFLDRLVLAVEPSHGALVSTYEALIAQRNAWLRRRHGDLTWVEVIEARLARASLSVIAARELLVRKLNVLLEALSCPGFPRMQLTMTCKAADLIRDLAAIDAEATLLSRLRADRDQDLEVGHTVFGPHRCDLEIRNLDLDVTARTGSSGQRQALMTGLLVAHATLIASFAGVPPIVLLDEPMIHLDRTTRSVLIDILTAGRFQTFMTATEADVVPDLGTNAHVITLAG